MTPIIVTDNMGKVKIVIGAAGGAKIISSVVNVMFRRINFFCQEFLCNFINHHQALVRVLWLGEDIKQAIDAPRIHHQLLPMILEYEYGNEQVSAADKRRVAMLSTNSRLPIRFSE